MPRLNKYDRSHLAHLSAYQRQVDEIYSEAAKEAARLAAQISDFNASAAFSFADYPMTRKRCDVLLERLKNGLYGVIANGIRSEWNLANNKNDELSRQVFGANVGRLSQAQYRRYFSTNGAARDAFIARRDAGMNLYDRVWNYTSQFKAEMEQVCDIGIRNGMSAEEMQRELQQYLNHPDNFFRRFRYKEGVDENGQPQYGRKWKKRYWDEMAGGYRWEDVDLNDPKYHYGRGVYRSSYKNARRLAVTETNIAYRTADHLRWQQMDFVVGIHIEPSNTNHPVIDICDTLAGDYPKDFKWTGWHPHCRCHATSILKTEEEMVEDNERILRGEEPLEGSVNAVRETPYNFDEWVVENESNIVNSQKVKKEPYFVRDNEAIVDNIIKSENAPYIALRTENVYTRDYVGRMCRTFEEVNFDFEDKSRDPDKTDLRQWLSTTPLGNIDVLWLDAGVRSVMAKFDDLRTTKTTMWIDSNDGSIEMFWNGKIFDLRRTFFIDKATGLRTVSHDLFQLEESFQRKGISKAIFKELYREYRAGGIEQITVHANINIGGYTWAMYGFRTQIAQVEAWAENNRNVFKLLSQFKRKHPHETTFPMRIIAEKPWGRSFLLGKDWQGVLDLRKASVRKYFEHYIGFID